MKTEASELVETHIWLPCKDYTTQTPPDNTLLRLKYWENNSHTLSLSLYLKL